MDSCGCWKLLSHVDLKLKKQIISTVVHGRGGSVSCGTQYRMGFSSHSNGLRDVWLTLRVNEGGGDSGP